VRFGSRAIFIYTQRAVTLLTFTPEEVVAIRLSLRVATVATLGSLPAGLLVAMLLARGRFWGRSVLNVFVYLPLVLPPVVTGYLLLVVFGRRGLVGAFLADDLGIVFAFRWTGAALASAVMGFPLMVRSMRLSIDGVDRGSKTPQRRWAPGESGSGSP
jgi:molybdate transport system permease protein